MHTNFAAEHVEARSAPVTEQWFAMVPLDASAELKSAVEDGALNIVKLAMTEGGAKAYGCGWGKYTSSLARCLD